jgi:hypothetical protein
MYRIKISGNFFVILNDSNQSEFARHPLKDCDYEQFDDLTINPLYRFTGIIKSFGTKSTSKTEFRFSELLDTNGIAFTSISILNTWLDENLGKFNASKNGAVEIDFGAVPVYQKEFTITDVSVLTTSNITALLAYEAPTDKHLDELEMDSLTIICGQATNGTFKILVRSIDNSYLSGKFKINYSITI